MHTVLVHVANEEAILAEVEELPGPADQLIYCINPRRRDGKDLHYVSAEVQTIIVPWWRINFVEVMPSFRGGDDNRFREWVQKRTNYPQAAIDAKIRGTVFLTFIVEKDGSVTSVTVIKGVHPLIDNEAVKSISQSPKWAPGLQRGLPVRVRYQIALNFFY